MGLFNEHSSTTKTDSSSTQGIPGPQGIGFKLDPNGNFDIENKKLTNVQNGDMDKDVMNKSQIESYVSEKTQYLDGVLPAKVTNNKAVIYSPSGGIHSNGLYLRDQNGQESHFINELQDLNQCRLYIPNLRDNDSFGGRLKSSIVITSISQTIEGKKIFHDIEVPNPTIDGHASNKAYVDNEISKISDSSDNTNYVKKSGDTMTGKLLVPNVLYPIQGDLRQAMSYESMREIFLSRRENRPMLINLDMNNHTIDNIKNAINKDQCINKGQFDNELELKANKSDLLQYLKVNGSYPMRGNINMNNNRITNLPNPVLTHEPTTKEFVMAQIGRLPNLFMDRTGVLKMLGNLNMNNHLVKNVKIPENPDDCANKKYVDDKSNNFLKVNGDNMMLADIRMNGNKITGLSEKPTNKYEATNKEYVDENVKKSQIGEAHTSTNILSYIMKDIDETSSEYGIEIEKIDNLDSSFHTFNKKVIYLNLIKDDNSYEARIGYNIFRLVDKNIDKEFTFVTEWLTTDNNAWNKMEIFSNLNAGKILGYHSKKYEDGNGLYYIRTITQVKIMKISTAPLYFYSTIHIENVNPTYPAKFKEVNNIIYGIDGSYENVPSKVYDKHNLYETSGDSMKMLVDLNMNNKKINNISNLSYNGIILMYGIIKKWQNRNVFLNMNNIPFKLRGTHIQWITIHPSNNFKNKADAIIIRSSGPTPDIRFPFNHAGLGFVTILINRYFRSILDISLAVGFNLTFELSYLLFY